MDADPAEGYTVLLVDDNPQLLKAYAEGLPLVGPFTVLTAENGAQGLERFAATCPHCLVIDVKMPELDGFQLVRAIRGDPGTAETPLIILTALTQSWDQLVGRAAGADEYLVKPVKPSELAAAIRRVCALSRDERARRLRAVAEELSEELTEETSGEE